MLIDELPPAERMHGVVRERIVLDPEVEDAMRANPGKWAVLRDEADDGRAKKRASAFVHNRTALDDGLEYQWRRVEGRIRTYVRVPPEDDEIDPTGPGLDARETHRRGIVETLRKVGP